MKPKSRIIPESIIERQIFAFLRSKGIYCWKSIQGGFYDPIRKIHRKQQSPYFLKGVSDCLGILSDGRMLAIEIKSATGRLSPEQKKFIEAINKSGGVAFMARTWEEVRDKLFPEEVK